MKYGIFIIKENCVCLISNCKLFGLSISTWKQTIENVFKYAICYNGLCSFIFIIKDASYFNCSCNTWKSFHFYVFFVLFLHILSG